MLRTSRFFVYSQFLTVVKTKWPECVTAHMTARKCQRLINTDIRRTFTGEDVHIRAKIMRIRTRHGNNYNRVVIRTREKSGRVVGVYGNGQVYYDL